MTSSKQKFIDKLTYAGVPHFTTNMPTGIIGERLSDGTQIKRSFVCETRGIESMDTHVEYIRGKLEDDNIYAYILYDVIEYKCESTHAPMVKVRAGFVAHD